MKTSSALAVLIAFFMALPTSNAQDMTSTAEQCEKFVNKMAGRWSGEITLIADWPGLKKKRGEKLVNYQTRRKLADGKSFMATITGGETTATDLCAFDPASRQIRIMRTNSAAGFFQGVI